MRCRSILKNRNIPHTLLKAIIYIQNQMSIKFNSKLSKLAEIKRGK
jgi:hypothetical protein